MPDLVVETDGFCSPNPGGLATWAFRVSAGGGEPTVERSGVAAAEPEGTNELAEWRAAFEAMLWLHANAPDGARVAFRNDNARVVRALAGDAPVPSEGEARRLAQECRRLWKELHERDVLVAFSRVPRWENAEADRLASEAHARATAERRRPWPGGREDLPPSRRGNR